MIFHGNIKVESPDLSAIEGNLYEIANELKENNNILRPALEKANKELHRARCDLDILCGMSTVKIEMLRRKKEKLESEFHFNYDYLSSGDFDDYGLDREYEKDRKRLDILNEEIREAEEELYDKVVKEE